MCNISIKRGYLMKRAIVKSGLVGLSLSLLLATGCATKSSVEEVDAKATAAQNAAAAAQKTADAALSAAKQSQQTADQALRAANDANEAVTRLSESVGRK